jgi:glycosyltransferase involved in cell wall biosynthesis
MQSEFENIIFIEQENHGVSYARNVGIDNASGKYLMFIDPDDYVQENSFDLILKTAELKGAQIAIAGKTFLDSDGNVYIRNVFDDYDNKLFTGIESYFFTHEKGQIDGDTSVGILYEADFLNKNLLRYLPDVPYLEDGEFLARIHCLADRCIFVNGSFYTRTTRPDSATHSMLFNLENARKGFITVASNLKRFQLEESLNESQKLFLNGPIIQFVLLHLYSAWGTRSFKVFETTVKNLQVTGFKRLMTNGCKSYYLICGRTYNISPYLGIIVLVIYLKIEWYLLPCLIKRKHHKKYAF